MSTYALLKAEEQVKQGEQAAQLADLNAAVIDRQSKRRRGMADIEQRKKQAAEALSQTKVEDTAAGDQQLLDQGIAALFGKKRPAGAGDIAVYLKKLLNEKRYDDDDIAGIAAIVSFDLEEQEEELGQVSQAS